MKWQFQLAIVLMVSGCFMISKTIGIYSALGVFFIVFGLANLLVKKNWDEND